MIEALLPDTDPILRLVAQPVTEFDDELWNLAVDMATTMYMHNGIGLAAPQVGKSIRLIVTAEWPYVLVNPEILERIGEQLSYEGCLSSPGKFCYVRRAQEVRVKFFESSGEEHTTFLKGLDAACIQHEIDHLDGILFTDRQEPSSPKTAPLHVATST